MDGKRKLGTDEIVAKAMEEEEGRKKQKKEASLAQPGTMTRRSFGAADVKDFEWGRKTWLRLCRETQQGVDAFGG